MEVNLWGMLQITKAVVPAMIERGGGHVVMVNSMSTHRILPRYGSYATSKGAQETAAKALATELGVHGIRVNTVFPGYIWADTVEQYFAPQASKRGITPAEVYREVADEAALTGRKSVVSGKSVSVRVDLGGRRIIKKKKTEQTP